MIGTTIASLFALGGICSLLFLAVTDYACQPYTPQEECKLGKYEIRIYAIDVKGSPIMGIAEGACVYSIGTGKTKRYAMREATFTAANRTEYFDRGVEIPAVQATVCEIR